MLRAGIKTDKGHIGIVGITNDNLIRMKAGMPLDIDLKDMGPPGVRITRVYVHYADTLEHVVDDMAEGGMPVNDELRQTAKAMDEQIHRERIARGRQQRN